MKKFDTLPTKEKQPMMTMTFFQLYKSVYEKIRKIIFPYLFINLFNKIFTNCNSYNTLITTGKLLVEIMMCEF